MNKKFLSAILFGALMVTSTGTFVSCKDYDDDIDELWDAVNAQKSDLATQVAALETALSATKTEAAAAKQAAADAAAKGDAAAVAAAEAKQAAADAKTAAIEEAVKLVNDLKAVVDTKVDQATYEASAKEIGSKIAAIETGLNKITPTVDANVQAIAALQTQMKAVEAYKTLIDGKADATEITRLEGVISTIQEDMKSIATTSALKEVETKVDAIRAQVAAIQENLVTILSKELRSLVFMPTLYVDGIEATEYAFGLGSLLTSAASEGDIKGQDDDQTPYTITKDEIYGYMSKMMDWSYNPTLTVDYHLNPSSAEVKKENLSFISRDVESISSRSANDSKAKPEIVDCSSKDGVLTVSYKADGEAITTAKNTVAIMALQADVKNGEKDTTITSDYASLYPSMVTPMAIAYSKGIAAVDCEKNSKSDHIYTTAQEAIEKAATIDVEFNGSVDLKDYLNIHYNQSNKALGLNDTKSAGVHKIWNYGEEALYDLEYKYSIVKYTVGSEIGTQTEEDKYGYVDATGHFEPRYVDANGNSVPSNGTTGVSAIGKKPVVRVEVVDKTTGEVVLGGFVKLNIVRTIAPVVAAPFDLGRQAYACDRLTKSVTWAQMSSQLLELAAVTSKAEFEQLYQLELEPEYGQEWIDGYEGSTGATYAYTYVKVDGKFVHMNTLKKYNNSNYYFGAIAEFGNVQGVANDRLQWDTYKGERDHIYAEDGHKTTVYVCYEPKKAVGESALPKIYVPLTLEVVKPVATYGEKIAEYWYENDKNTQRLNVQYPKNGGNTESYLVNMDNAFVGNEVNFTITNNENGLFEVPYDANHNPIASAAGSVEDNWIMQKKNAAGEWVKYTNTKYQYFFTKDNDNRTYTTADGAKYTLKVINNNKVLVAIDKAGVQHTIATLGNIDGMDYHYQGMKYAGTDAPNADAVAKKLLNEWAHNAETSYYANVGIKAVSATCDIELGTWDFKARFLRPIDVAPVTGKYFTDAEANGSTLNIADMLSFSDWRNIAFTGANGWLYAFYDVKRVQMNPAGITTNMNGGTLGKTLLSSVTTLVNFSVVDNTFDLSAYNDASNAASCLSAIKSELGSITYTNNGNNVQKFTVRIPINITYEWGTITTNIDCEVRNTIGN